VNGGDAKMLGVGGGHLDRARAANVACVGAPTLPAWQRFTGVVWDHLDVGTLPAAARRNATERLVVVSGLGGLSGLDDPLPDFRLKMSVTVGDLGRVANHWRPLISPLLNDLAAGGLVVDLLPAEHAAAWEPDPERYELVRVDLVDEAGRKAGHAAKAAKGLLARQLVSASGAKAVRALLDERHTVGGFTVTPR
jgi:cytoplasmic iron level regulating protein YaaA (DUF328/UPF0246 family)